jgi:4-amino-4-deoxy-L-arabinose transferase-like glycosyltransferase
VPILDKATGRVVAVIVLLIAIAASLRGYLPGVSHADRPPPQSGASLFYVAALLGVSLVIVAVAMIVRLRDPRRMPSTASPLPARFSDGSGRPAWRVMVIAAAVLVGWLVLAWLLSRFIGSHRVDQPQSAPPATASPPKGNAAQRPGPQDNGEERDVLRYLIATTVALLLMTVVGAVAARRRRVAGPRTTAGQPLGEPAPVAAAATSLVRAAESGLAEVEDPDREPRQAIIACYAAMELELRRHPGAIPQDFDTPSEVLARAVEHHTLQADNATELVNLFEEARFSPHVMTETHRGRAMDVLGLVLADMRRSA